MLRKMAAFGGALEELPRMSDVPERMETPQRRILPASARYALERIDGLGARGRFRASARGRVRGDRCARRRKAALAGTDRRFFRSGKRGYTFAPLQRGRRAGP